MENVKTDSLEYGGENGGDRARRLLNKNFGSNRFVVEFQFSQEREENRETYLAWKKDWERTGKTPSDAVAWCRARGFTGYADWLESFILQMEGSD